MNQILKKKQKKKMVRLLEVKKLHQLLQNTVLCHVVPGFHCVATSTGLVPVGPSSIYGVILFPVYFHLKPCSIKLV